MQLSKIFILICFFSMHTMLNGQSSDIGHWTSDDSGLPVFDYTGSLPYTATYPNGEKVKLPTDPWFLLGNYRMALFTHISGNYQLISGQREWARLNQGDSPCNGTSSAYISVNGPSSKIYQLTGEQSLAADPKTCKRTFGCGFAAYDYKMDELEVTRNLSVKPSTNPYDGLSAFVISVTLKNTSSQTINLDYTESIRAAYKPMNLQRVKEEEWNLKYNKSITLHQKDGIVIAVNQVTAEDPFLIPEDRFKMSQYDGYPPALYMKSMGKNADVSSDDENLLVHYKLKIKPNRSKTVQLVVGYTFDPSVEQINKVADELCTKEKSANKFAKNWLKVLPSFPNEQNEVFKREMVWNAYNLEALATYNQYYEETKIPQGTVYAFQWGMNASTRDNYQHAMPLPHYNPALAKSVMKYMMKRTTPQGRARLIEWGVGYSSSWYFYTSDQQLFSFMYFAEYLRATKDYSIFDEKAAFFPYRNMPESSILDFMEAEFKFLRDQVKTGKHGLVRLLNSDWNDFVYHVVKKPYNNVLYSGESHMNSAMAISILDDLIPQLKLASSSLSSQSMRLNKLIQSMQMYRDGINDAFMKDLGDRKFPRRLYFDGQAYGEENMFLEPQGYTLQINNLSIERKKTLYKEMQARVYNGEKIAARQQQTPEFESEEYEKGSRENGGVWWALNGPVILGVGEFDKKEAWRLLQNITFDNSAKQFPNYWSSYWSQADNFESSLMPGEGLPDQTDNMFEIPVFCAHAHAWPLYCYYKLKE